MISNAFQVAPDIATQNEPAIAALMVATLCRELAPDVPPPPPPPVKTAKPKATADIMRARIEAIKTLAETGMTTMPIALELGLPAQTVRHAARVGGLELTNRIQQHKNRIEYVQRNMDDPNIEIARALGIAVRTVSKMKSEVRKAARAEGCAA